MTRVTQAGLTGTAVARFFCRQEDGLGSRDESPGRRRTDVESTGHEQRLRILAVDDDPAYLRYLQHVLTRSGFAVDLAADGNEAIARLHEEPRIDLLLVDLAMPGMDGIETVRRIHEEARTPALYTILLTARDAVETKLRALNSGLDDFVSKTSSESEILAKIRSAARRLELERRLHTLAMTDELTGIANRRALFVAGDDVIRSGQTVTVLLFDLDHFKLINDTLGHLAGDRILAEAAGVLKSNTRYNDIVGRYGGDEFLVVLPGANADQGRQVAERLQGRLRQRSISAQFGVAPAATTLSDAIAVCDQALYRGKKKRASDEAPSRDLRP